MKFLIFVILFSILFFDLTIAVDIPCGDWESYKDEKCYKIFDKVAPQTFYEAHQFCSQHDHGQIVSISSPQKQAFLTEYLFKRNHVAANIWIGAHYENGAYQWENGRTLSFSNWATGNPKNLVDYCTVMHAETGSLQGKWTSELCAHKNLVVCQKNPILTLPRLQDLLIDVKEEIEDLENLKAEVGNLVPVGFIYVQLPSQKSPTEIWPSMTWTEVSSTYAGVFFRVSGGQAAAFGSTQEEFSPYIDQLEHNYCTYRPNNTCEKLQIGNLVGVPRNGWSGFVYTTDKYNFDEEMERMDIDAMKVHVQGGEVRPKNMAIKVWKRSG